MGHAQVVEGLGHHEVDEVVRSCAAGCRSRASPAARSRPARVTAAMFSMWIRLSGVSRGISTSRRRSFSITSAQRWMRLRAVPWAIAASVAPEHGAISAAGASDDPEAKGAVRSLSPSTVTEPDSAPKRSTKVAITRPGSSGGRRPGLEDLVADDVGAGVAHAQPHVAPRGRQGPQSPPGVHGAARSRDPEEDPHHPSDGSGVPAPRTRPAERGGRPAGRASPTCTWFPGPRAGCRSACTAPG